MIGKFLRNCRGNFAMTFALALVPMIGVAGLAVDYSGVYRLRAEMQNAADSAALAAATAGNVSNRERKRIARQFYRANINSATEERVRNGRLDILKDGVRYRASAVPKTSLLRFLGHRRLRVDVVAEVGLAQHDVELALVLDTSGSMAPYMNAMKTAAKDFVDKIDAVASGDLKFSVVPFVAAVNVGGLRNLRASEVDRSADSRYHLQFLEGKAIYTEASRPRVDAASQPCVIRYPNFLGGSTEERASLPKAWRWLAMAGKELFGVPAAAAQSPGRYLSLFPRGWTSNSPCRYSTPQKLNTFDLLAEMRERWKGCVEARPGDFDVSDDPAGSNPDTRWVPYFWPDEEVFEGLIPHNHYFGGYYSPLRPSSRLLSYPWAATRNTLKYDSQYSFDIDNSPPSTLGPNKACPDPVLPLTNRINTVKNKIDSLNHWNDGGTIASEGIAWGMRVLSPGRPFTQGARQHDDLKKVMVLFGDGRNNMPVNLSASPMITDYGAYSYAGVRLLSTLQRAGYRQDIVSGQVDVVRKVTRKFLDERTALACKNAKEQGITVMTILFNEPDRDTQKLYRECASDPAHAVVASNVAAMEDAFQKLGNQIAETYLRK